LEPGLITKTLVGGFRRELSVEQRKIISDRKKEWWKEVNRLLEKAQ
jgi:hypothetical protein